VRGRFVIADDGTLAGADRTVLAGHLGNPEILSPRAVPLGGFPPGLGWEAMLAAFDRRRGEYWLVLDPFAIAMGALTEIEGALGANRSLAGGAALTGLAAGGPARPDAAALFEALGEATAPASAAHELLMAREAAPVVLGQVPGIVRFGPEEAHSHAEAALPVIAELGRSG